MNLLDDSGNESQCGLGTGEDFRRRGLRRRICLFRFSNPLLVRMRGQLEGGNRKTVKPSGRFVSIQSTNSGLQSRYGLALARSIASAALRDGALKMSRNVGGNGGTFVRSAGESLGILAQVELTALPGH